jgi:RNA polymerase sigma factor (sigma-70 family)
VAATSPISRSLVTYDDAVRVGSPVLRRLSDERLVALVRGGHYEAFDVLVNRYEARLVAFCRRIVRSREDAEDLVQDVFAAAFSAMLADQRPIHVRPWLYRIARNRSLNELRRIKPRAVDSLEEHPGDHGLSAADRVDRREEFRQLVDDIKRLPEAQRRALALREMAGLSYEQLAVTLEKTVPSVKSLLFRARLGLAQAVEAREASIAVGRSASSARLRDGNRPAMSPVAHRHLGLCERCGCTDQPAHSPNGLPSPVRRPARDRIALDRSNTDSSPSRPAACRADGSQVTQLRR